MTAMHTPGPWNVAESYIDMLDDGPGAPETVIRGMDGEAVIAVALDFGSNNPTWREANARLIAAAPDLLATLNSILVGMEASGGWVGDDGLFDAGMAAYKKATAP